MGTDASGKKYTTIAIVLYHVVTFLEGFNLQCTPVCMRAFEMSLGLTASRLSVVFATELLSLLGIAAVWGYLVGKKEVKYICSLGMLLCGIACILIGCTSGFSLVLVCRFLHGAGLSCVGPVYSKIITEQWKKDQNQSSSKDETSKWFSVANGAHCAGKVLSLMLVSVLATRNVVGQYGWRLCYCVTGYLWLMVAVVVFFFMTKEGAGSDTEASVTASSGNNKAFYKTSTFWVMACVMYTSETPFVMLGYMVMYFQYSGLSNKMAGFVGAVIQIGAVAGSCSGGYAVDWCHKKWEEEKGHGRFTFAMGVLALRFLAVISILFRPIESGVLQWYHWVELFIFGLTLFVASAVDRPTVSDIAKGNESLAGSLFRVAGGVPSSATISPIIALLAEKFGYIESKELLEDMDIHTRMANVNALRMSLICVGGVLTVLNILLYIPVFFTYQNDKKGGNAAVSAGAQGGGPNTCSNTSTGSGGSTSTNDTSKVTYPWHAIVLYHVFTFLDAYSTQSLYVCMGAFEVDLGISPSSLSIVAMAHMLSELALSPLWGYLVDNKERHYVECIAMLIIGITSILLGCTSCYPLILVLRLLHGASLGCTGPVIQKIITGWKSECEQATWFGIYAAVFGFGSLLGSGINSLLSMKNLLGLYGWRLSYCIMGYAWLLTAPLVFYFMKPEGPTGSQGDNGKPLGEKLGCIFKVNSYWLLVAVMFASEAAYAFMAYIPLYLQYSGLSEMAIAFLCAVVVFGGMFGGLFGGKLIDWCHEKSPDYGRLGFAVDALLIRLMYITILMWWPIPKSGLTWEHYAAALIVGATLVTVHSVDRPMLDDVVQKGSEGTALSFLRMISGIPSSLFFPPLIANLAERVYGYVKGAGFGEGADRVVMASNANALRRSIMYIMIGATAVNVALYVGLFFTYKGDKNTAKGGQTGQQSNGQQNKCGESEKKQTGDGKYPWYAVVLYHVVSFINAYDTQILSLSMRALEASLGLSASSLSIMASMEGVTLMGFAPVWGYLLTLLPCQYVCAAGMALCGISCILLAQVTTFSWILLIRLAHGIGLSCAAPVAVHIIAANWGKKNGTTGGANGKNNSSDGTWSGINNGIVTLGKLMCFFLTGRYAGQKVFGHSGWRLSYAVVGCVWLFAALPVCLYMTKDGGNSGKTTNNDALGKLKNIVGKPKFWAMTVVMFFSEAPYVIMGYMVMYLQYSGLSTVMIGSAIIVMQVGTAIGSVAGGFIAGIFDQWQKQYGRLSLATCALLIRLMYFVIFLWWPLNEHGLTWHRYCLLFVIGLTMLVSPTIEKPIVSDLDKDAASMTVPLYRAIGGMPSYFVFMPLLGWMAEKMYGYVKPSGDVSQLGHVVMSVNANALRKSMMWILSIATILNIGLYVVVHYAEKLGKALKPASCPTTTTPTPTTTTSSSSNEITYHWYARVLCFVPAFVQGVNLQLLPICMRAFEITLGLSPSRLSWIPSVQIMFYLGVSPLWGILLDNLNRKVGDVQCIATCLCGISCILLGYVSHYPLVMLFTVLNGCGNAACIAVAPKMINEDKRMKEQPTLWFGVNWSVYCVGALISAYITVSLSMKTIGGVYGWRVCHCLVGYLWLAVAAPIFYWMKKTGNTAGGGGADLKDIKCIMQKTTFWLMVCVGYTSQAAFAVLVYLTMYLQSSGVPGMSIGFAFTVVMIGNLAGGFSGGFMTDEIHKLSGCYGKLSVGAVTVFIRVLAVLAFLWSPIPGGTFRWYHHIYLFVYGITFFTIKAVDISISADLAPGSLKSLTIGLVGAIGGVTSNATVVPAVGYLCENKFGYVTSTEGGDPLPPEVMANNVSALRNSMLIVFVVCSVINIALYLVALATYKNDKEDKKETCTKTPAETTSTPSCNKTSEESKTTATYGLLAKVLYHVYPVMDAIDMEILPICMRAFEVSFGCSPATLSVVGAAEQGALLLMSPLWGYLLTIIKPYQVESAAMLVCGMMCIILGTTTNYRMLVLATLIHGATLGCTGPTHQKIITSSVKKEERDTWYGIYTGVYYLGAMASSILASRLSLRNVLGQYGWRLYYCVVGYMWLAAAVPTYFWMQPDNKSQSSGGDSSGQSGGNNKNDFWKSIGDLFKKPSYYFMISLIYVSESCELFMGYIVIYLQYCGVRNQMAGFAISVVHMGNMIAGFIGGYAIQKIHCASKDYGKLLTGIGLIAIRLFAITLLLRKPFQGGDMRWYHYMCLALFGFAQLNRTSIDRTMLSDFVKEDDAAIALSLCRVIAGIPSNFTFPPLIGYLAERAFGYIKTDALVEDMDAFTKVTNATALSKSLLYIMGGSCLANMALYGGMMFTYSKDVAKKEAKERGTGSPGAPGGGTSDTQAAPSSGSAGGAGGAGAVGGSGGAATGKKEYELIAFILAAFVSFMDGFDTQILPSCMKVFEMDLGLTPSMLSVINSASFLSLLVASPLWGSLVDKYNCGYIQCIAMLLAGLTCVLHGYTSSYPVIVILTIFNGAGLACTAPIDQKIITANWSDNSGVYFGISWTCYCLGRVASSTIGSRLIMRNIAGQYGWRMYCFLTGYIWIIASVVVHFYMKKNRDAAGQGDSSSSSNCPKNENKGDFFQKFKRLSTITTFWLLIPIKYASSAPLVILSYMVMYYQNSGLSDNMAGFAVGIVQLGSGIGGISGGLTADAIHKKESNYARIGFAIGALVLRVLCVILLLWSPLEGGSLCWYQYGGSFVMGLTLFTIQTVDKAMLGNVVSKSDQSTAISLVYFAAGIPSSTTLPTFVGYMAEKRFGYVVSKSADEPLHPVTMANNATALRKAMIYCMLIASAVNIICYCATMKTYKGDVDKLKKECKEANECKETKGTEEGNGTVSSGEAGGGSGTSNVGGTSETQAAPSSEGGGSSGRC
ncbi:multiplied multi-transmembrane transporter-like protein [Babesia gibsoni]|uniref:Multiplied multi-transmembrane transporter-like protein n=1 Tax=Babesia gibsoni TaxID=33632 RepID=A0AAD8LMW9_BABGI|nr:multiplied multi-transmembrane transporter-like protein [Babesia gibsoni]